MTDGLVDQGKTMETGGTTDNINMGDESPDWSTHHEMAS
jgi:hypothetical protein